MNRAVTNDLEHFLNLVVLWIRRATGNHHGVGSSPTESILWMEPLETVSQVPLGKHQEGKEAQQ